MKELVLVLSALLLAFFSNQKVEAQTAHYFRILGAVENETILNMDSLASFKNQKIDSVIIFDHTGQRRSTLQNLKVVPLREALNSAVIKVENSKLLSEFYFVCEATDGYKVVFSWNEVFNNPLGDSIFIIIQRNRKSNNERDEGFEMLSPTDNITGRRYLKKLKSITVRRAD